MGAPCRRRHNRCCCARHRSSRQRGFLEAWDIYGFHHHSAEIWSKLSQQLNARSLHPDIFSGRSSIRLKHQSFCSSKVWTPAVLRHSTSDCRTADSLALLVSLPPQRKTEESCLQHSIGKHFLIAVFQVCCQLFQTCRTGQSHCTWCCPEPEESTYMQESLDVCCCWVWSKSANRVTSKSLCFSFFPPTPLPRPRTQQFDYMYEQVHQETPSVQEQFSKSQNPGMSPDNLSSSLCNCPVSMQRLAQILGEQVLSYSCTRKTSDN